MTESKFLFALPRKCCMNLEDLYRLLRSGHVQAQAIVDTLDSPLIVLDAGLNVVSANRAFFSTFKVSRDETVGRPLLALGVGQWDLPGLRTLLIEVIPNAAAVIGYEVTHDFPGIGERTMLLTARRLVHPDDISTTMLLAFQDVTEARHVTMEADILLAETRHRMKNLLATMRAIATQTSSAGRTADEYKAAFLGRFQAVRAFLFVAHKHQFSDHVAASSRLPVFATRASLIFDASCSRL
jgi:transcriptional regulator with PAS, ATPase and Fis domain